MPTYAFRIPAGVMVIARHDDGWFASLNGVVLGQFASAQIAADALADPVDFSAALRAFLADLAIPADLSRWRTLD